MPETAIVWVRNPEDFPFVRVKEVYATRRRGWAAKWLPEGTILIGYAEVDTPRDVMWRYRRRVFVLHEGDYPLGKHYDWLTYGRPSEAIDPLTLAPNEPGRQTDRCWHHSPAGPEPDFAELKKEFGNG